MLLRALICVCLSFAPAALCDDSRATGPADAKRATRWTLDEWLNTRDRMRLMDLWLMMHSPSPYEFYFGASYAMGTSGVGQGMHHWEFTAAGYAHIFGVELQYHTVEPDRWLGLVNMRLLGAHNQATHFTLQGGVERYASAALQPVAGAHLTVYLTRSLGVNALVRYGFAQETLGATLRGELGGFVEFKWLRVGVDYISQTMRDDPAASMHSARLGLRAYF